eukprot:763159-Hanusia_phi.AAC.5
MCCRSFELAVEPGEFSPEVSLEGCWHPIGRHARRDDDARHANPFTDVKPFQAEEIENDEVCFLACSHKIIPLSLLKFLQLLLIERMFPQTGLLPSFCMESHRHSDRATSDGKVSYTRVTRSHVVPDFLRAGESDFQIFDAVPEEHTLYQCKDRLYVSSASEGKARNHHRAACHFKTSWSWSRAPGRRAGTDAISRIQPRE